MRWWFIVAFWGCYSPRALDSRCARCSPDVACLNGDSCIDGLCQPQRGACSEILDGGSDRPPIDAPAGCFGVEAAPFHVMCVPATQAVPGIVTLTGTITTGGASNSCTYIDPLDAERAKPPLCVIVADVIDITASHTITGARPLVLIARDRLTIAQSGVLDLAGHATDPPTSTTVPAAANEPGCTAATGAQAVGASGAGGGAGGSFKTRGGNGGPSGGGTSAAPNVMIPNPHLRGGCRGGDGGLNGEDSGGTGGNSGGAIYLLATEMRIDGTINASGGGGRGLANVGTGGGGGGSGGMILLWSAQAITVGSGARVFALGGGGSSGGSGFMSPQIGDDPGGPTDPATSTPSARGAGSGGGGTLAEDGQAGAQGAPTSGPNGGGGGGGGVGHIRAMPPIPPSGKFAPPPS